MNILEKLKRQLAFFLGRDEIVSKATCPYAPALSERDLLTDFLINIYWNYDEQLKKSDLVLFSEINVHCAFKYEVVKEILNDKEVFGVSTVHLSLNSLYFSKDETLHMHNKKMALKHLPFLGKEFQTLENPRVTEMFEVFLKHTPKSQPFNFVDVIVKPLLFLNSMDEFDLFESFPEFNSKEPNFSFDTIVKRINDFYADMDNLTFMLENYLEGGGKFPNAVTNLIDDLKTDSERTNTEVVKFLKSMIFATVESTGSYITSLVYELYFRFPEMLNSQDLSLSKLQQISNEVLRIHTPVPFIFRTVARDAERYGKHLKVGDMVAVYIGVANLDPSVFETPKEFNLGRREKHLAFGRGHLGCIGESASFRMALNVIQNLRKENVFFKIVDSEPLYEFENSMLKILTLNVLLHDKS